MYMKTINLTLTVPVEICCNTGIDQATRKLVDEIQADHYDDGRYPFYMEMMTVALSKIVQAGVERSVEDYMKIKYGNEMKTTDTSQYLKAFDETAKWMKSDFQGVSVSCENWKASIEDVKTINTNR